jgi:hypothetical protein
METTESGSRQVQGPGWRLRPAGTVQQARGAKSHHGMDLDLDDTSPKVNDLKIQFES